MMDIKHLHVEDVTVYAYEGGELREIPRVKVKERLRFERRSDGTLVAEQTLDTPVGILDYEELLVRTANDQLLKPAPCVTETNVSLAVRTAYGGTVLRSIVNGDRPHLDCDYWTVDSFGVIRSSVDVWTGETFVRDFGIIAFVCDSPNRLRVYEDEREAAFHNNSFGDKTMADRLAFDSFAEGEIRHAVRKLREVLERHDARIVYDQDNADLLFAKKTPPDGWDVRSDCRGSEFKSHWFEIPAYSYRDFGLGDCNYFHVDFPEFIVKKEG